MSKPAKTTLIFAILCVIVYFIVDANRDKISQWTGKENTRLEQQRALLKLNLNDIEIVDKACRKGRYAEGRVVVQNNSNVPIEALKAYVHYYKNGQLVQSDDMYIVHKASRGKALLPHEQIANTWMTDVLGDWDTFDIELMEVR